MTINPVQHVVPAPIPGSPGASVPDPAASVTSPDRVETHETDHVKSSVAKAVSMIASSRSARLQSLAQAVRSGAYQPMPADVADQILAQAELEARLAAYFH